MYDTGGLLPVDSLPAGVFLCTGPPMVGKRALLLRLLAHGVDSGEGCVVVSTDRTAAEIDDDLAGFRRDPSATVPLGYVDGSGNAEDGVAGVPTEMAGSPTDLTGIGMGLSRQLERMATAGEVDGIRVGLLSLSTMLLYSDPERVLRYLHVFGQRTKEAGALALVLAHSESLDTEVAGQIRSFADGAIELREDEDGHRLRVKGLDGVDSGWGSVPDPRVSPSGPAAVPDRSPESPPVASLRALIDDVRADQPTLTVGNYTGDEATLDRIESHFRTLQVGVRTTDLGFASPTDVAMLHRGDDLLASSSVADIDAAITLDDEPELAGTTAPLLDAVDQTTFDAVGADRRFLVRTSHTIEALAARGGRSTPGSNSSPGCGTTDGRGGTTSDSSIPGSTSTSTASPTWTSPTGIGRFTRPKTANSPARGSSVTGAARTPRPRGCSSPRRGPTATTGSGRTALIWPRNSTGISGRVTERRRCRPGCSRTRRSRGRR
ncbi:hypothetical protein GJ629_05050 [Halapricum sp. CBA1109]|uniref:RAD55 family ATPase n=1 Tax=Halapricum sp. CBA1109 TaxID=2668068 RepID=UPI0012FC9E27|nr:hypothetical protein [Halapricum sp. CBA1109]MUV89346.1 hypothetical protein [Halapricum sp. CBA1109]